MLNWIRWSVGKVCFNSCYTFLNFVISHCFIGWALTRIIDLVDIKNLNPSMHVSISALQTLKNYIWRNLWWFTDHYCASLLISGPSPPFKTYNKGKLTALTIAGVFFIKIRTRARIKFDLGGCVSKPFYGSPKCLASTICVGSDDPGLIGRTLTCFETITVNETW